MTNGWFALVAAMAVWGGSVEAAELPTEPPALRSMIPVNLPDLVYAALPAAGTQSIGWDHMLNAPVQWVTDGYTSNGRSAVRDGITRVRVGGRVTTVLRRARQELFWTVEMDTIGNVSFGPQEISIKAGGDGNEACFGSLFDACTFTPKEALTSPKFKAQYLCQIGEASDYHRFYRVTAPGKAPMRVSYDFTEGSGGATTDLTLTLASAQTISGFSDPLPKCAR